MKYLITKKQKIILENENDRKIIRVLNYLNSQEFFIDNKKIIREPEFENGIKYWKPVAFFNWKNHLVVTQYFFDKLTTMFSLSPQETNIIIKNWIKNLFDGKEIEMFYTSDVDF